MSARRLTVIGLDAATFTVVGPLVETGELPNLARILRSGSYGDLRSTTHPLTPQAWATMVTGVNAGRHGLWDFVERTDGGYRLNPVNGSYRRAPAVWDYLGAAGRTAGIVNVPFTAPAPEVEGFALAGLDASIHEEGAAFPRELGAELERRFGVLELDHRFPLDAHGRADLDLVRRACEQKVAVTSWLAERFDPELLFVVFMSADHIHHLAWPEWDREGAGSRVAEVYRILDGAVGALLDAGGWDRDVLVVSDHGGGRLDGVVNLNAWLAREGFLAYAPPRAGEAARRALWRAYELRRHVPERLRRRAKRRLGAVRERAHDLRQYAVVDWPRTRAFAYGTFGNVVINLRGREEQGIVPEEDYDRVRADIAARALELRGPGGDRLVAAVHRREDLFEGPALESVPDLVIEFDDYRWLGKGNLTRRTPELWDAIEIPRSDEVYVGSHRHEGLIALAGPSAAEGVPLDARIEDVAPTLLYLLGEPIPSSFEGRVLTEAIRAELLDERPPVFGDADVAAAPGARAYGGEAAAEVTERLRSLGYLE